VHWLKIIDQVSSIETTVTIPGQNGQPPLSLPVSIDSTVQFFVNSYLPFRMNQLNIQTILIIITCM
jgi:hypothetical protein